MSTTLDYDARWTALAGSPGSAVEGGIRLDAVPGTARPSANLAGPDIASGERPRPARALRHRGAPQRRSIHPRAARPLSSEGRGRGRGREVAIRAAWTDSAELLPAPRRVAAPALQGAPRRAPAHLAVRLTARGRMVLVATTAALLVLAAFGLGRVSVAAAASGSAGGSAGGSASPSATITVGARETLWQVAGVVAPGHDRRVTVERIMAMNRLTSAVLTPGQRLRVPVRSG